MAHRVALYRVRVRPKRDLDGWKLLGDFDDGGSWFGATIAAVLKQLTETSPDGKVIAQAEKVLPGLKTSEAGYSILSGRSGVTSVLQRAGQAPYDRTPQHVETMRSAVLFDLPRNRHVGHLAVHVPDGRSCKGIVERALRARASQLGLIAELGPIVPLDAFRQAVADGKVEQVTLIKHDPATADKFADAAQWGTDEIGSLYLGLPSKRRHFLSNDPLVKFLAQPSDANRKAILEFAGLRFDEAAVKVELPDGTERSFFLEGHEAGHTVTTGIEIKATGFDRFGAKPDQLVTELRKALNTVAGDP